MIDEKKLIDWIRQAVNDGRYDGYEPAAVLYEVRDTIQDIPKVGEWIPVSEGTPEDPDESVLITVNGTYKNITYEDAVMLAVYDKDEGWIIDGYQYWLTAQVTAWQPLPEPWKGEVNE